jgi:tRNA G10  N-methylase Trm11
MTVKHPAKYSPEILPVIARYVDGARSVLDPFAGTGRIGQIKGMVTGHPPAVVANELEHVWLAEARSNGCDIIIQGDARTVSRGLGGFRIEAVATSPAYGNRMAAEYAAAVNPVALIEALLEITDQ